MAFSAYEIVRNGFVYVTFDFLKTTSRPLGLRRAKYLQLSPVGKEVKISESLSSEGEGLSDLDKLAEILRFLDKRDGLV